MTASRSMFALLLVGTVFVQASGALAADKMSLAVNQVNFSRFPVLQAYVTILDAGGAPVVGLPAEVFEVKEDAATAEGVEVAGVRTGGGTLAAVLAIDRSGSMRGEAIKQALAAAAAFTRELAAGDLLGLVSFDDRVEVLSAPTTDRGAVLEQLGRIKLGRDTALNDAVVESLKLLGSTKTARKAVIILTDGKENRSKAKLDAVLAAAREGRVPVHTVGLGADVDARALDRLAGETGGIPFRAANPGALVELYRRIAQILGNQYVVTFRSPGQLDNRWHRVTVAATVRDVRVEGSLQYLATPDPGPNTAELIARAAARRRREMLAVGGTLALLIAALGIAVVAAARSRGLLFR